MPKKIAIFVDWENIRKGIFEKAATSINNRVNYNEIGNVTKLINSFLDNDEEEVYRIFFYLTHPYGGRINGVNFARTAVYQNSKTFIKNLAIVDNIAIRKGNLEPRGFDNNNKPIFTQKQVDMLLGLDIAHVSYNKLADRVLILSADTDMLPAMKTARINGLQVVFGYCPDVQNDIKRKLKEHSDFVREKNFTDIFPVS